MPETRLREALSELHAALEDTSAIDAPTRAELRAAHDEIEEALALDREEASVPADRARSRISDAVTKFEADHPEGVEILQRVLHALSNVGI